MSETTKVLIAARKSRLIKGQDSVSIERQDEWGKRYAAEVGDDDPIIAAGPGISGGISPFKHPELGPYLTDTPPRPWTLLWASQIDRIGRNARDLAEVRAWCEDRGKRIKIHSPSLEWPPDEFDVA
jgi:hypothetical protein